ncbi:hypothetical protein N800_08910 [Lysobacter daejeonensis GH1-9]|uniref:DUF1508 domain-containing protein n=1 Tax=Lysobacter daejeonensis GH1-9 TaxID=1385517 RepID=A0A0A0F176_9GAMM|nr:YegP family protein [Lysobacter daejeonensis]KGM56305.1 hypothetical protein N800_08910 [Lysobacter daejeonensis GH1-9]
MAGKFVLKTATNGETYFRLQAGNGQVILKSEMYKTKASALAGVESVKNNAASDARYERKDAAGGQFMFNLKATNGQVIGTSELYKTEASRDAGIESVKNHAPSATSDDQTAPSHSA